MLKGATSVEEKKTYRNWKSITDPKERATYAPKKTKYSAGVGVNRYFGVLVWNESRERAYNETVEV